MSLYATAMLVMHLNDGRVRSQNARHPPADRQQHSLDVVPILDRDRGRRVRGSMIAWGSSCVNGLDADSYASKHAMEKAAGVAIANPLLANTCVRPDTAHGWYPVDDLSHECCVRVLSCVQHGRWRAAVGRTLPVAGPRPTPSPLTGKTVWATNSIRPIVSGWLRSSSTTVSSTKEIRVNE